MFGRLVGCVCSVLGVGVVFVLGGGVEGMHFGVATSLVWLSGFRQNR